MEAIPNHIKDMCAGRTVDEIDAMIAKISGPTKTTHEDYARLAANARADNDDLDRRYGTGVRPGWVSCDKALNDARIQKYTHKAETLRWLTLYRERMPETH